MPVADNRSALVSMRAYGLLAGGLGWHSLSGQCYAVDQIVGFFALSCWQECWSWVIAAAR